MNILQICSKSPYPPREGGPIAMNNITQGLLKAGHSVKVLAVNTPKYNIRYDEIPETYLKDTGYEAVFIDTDIKIHKAFFNLFSSSSYNVDRFMSHELNEIIKHLLTSTSFDIVQLESIYVAPYIETIRKHSEAKIVLRAHNIEHLIWQRLTDNCINPIKKLYLIHLTKNLKRYEIEVLNRVDGIAAITPVDTEFITSKGITLPVISIPVGIDHNMVPVLETEREFPGLFHLGSMDWLPNQEGIRWFLNKVWPDLSSQFPELQLHLAGRNMPEWLVNLNIAGIEVQGEVNNAHDYMQSKSLMIVPLLAGSGMRVKIIEGMACGNTIISTSTGAEGIACTDGRDILIANTPEEFTSQIKKCIENPCLSNEIGKNAQWLISEEYDNVNITGKLLGFYEMLVKEVR